MTPDIRQRGLEARIAKVVYQISGVQDAYYKREDNKISLWTIIDDPNLRNDVYDKEEKLCLRFPKIAFSLVVVSSPYVSKPIENLIPDNYMKLPR